MALVVGTDTYISAADAGTYLAAHYMSTDAKLVAWTALTADNKDVCLRRAAKTIDRLILAGIRATSTQTMEFPRALFSDGSQAYQTNNRLLGSGMYVQESVPDAVKYAQCEIAIELAQGSTEASERASLQRQGVKSFSLGKLSESYSGITISEITSVEARRLLAPFTLGGARIG